MKNVWKGLTVGAFAGAAVGVALDAAGRLGAGGHRAAEAARTRGAEIADEVAARVHDAR